MGSYTPAYARSLEQWTPPDLSVLRHALANPEQYRAEREHEQAKIDALFVGHDARVRAVQEARWALECDLCGEARGACRCDPEEVAGAAFTATMNTKMMEADRG